MTMTTSPSVLGRLRSLVPHRAEMSFDEALRIAELQASHLVEALGGSEHLDAAAIDSMPRIRIAYEPLAVSGMSHWTGNDWLIAINSGDSFARQRFTLLHEFKHIVDHGFAGSLYRGSLRASAAVQAERAADYFAGCALVPKRELKARWGGGMQQPQLLAAHFGVSVNALLVRLDQTKLNASSDRSPAARCARPVRSPVPGPQHFRVARSPRSLA